MSGSADAGRLLVRIEATTAQLRQQLQAAEQQVGATTAKIDGQLKQADRAFARLEDASKAAQSAVAGLSSRLGPIGSVLTALGPAGIAAGAAIAVLSGGLVAVAKAGDAATATLARLGSATGSAAQAQAVYERLFQLSQQTGVAITESAGAFTRFAVAAKDIGGTNEQVLKLVTGIQKAGIVSGTAASESAAGVMQIGQALASGVLQGDELRSLLENMPVLAQALARELGVGIGQLRQMGSEGKLTSDVVFPALLRASEKMNAEFDKMPPTMSRAFDILGASMTQFAADLDKALGLSQAIARAVKAAADAVNGVRRVVTPSDREAASDAVTAAQRQLDQVRAQVAAERAASAYGDVAPGLAQALAIAEKQLREAVMAEQAIMRDARETEHAEQADAARQAAETAKTKATLGLKALAEDLDKRFKLRQDYEKKIKKLDADEGKGGVPPAGISFASLRLAALKEYEDGLKAVAKEEAKGGEEARKATEKRQKVIEGLEEQIIAAKGALAVSRDGTASSREFAIALETEAKLREAGIPGIEKRTAAQQKDSEAIAAAVRQLDALKEASKAAEEAARKAKAFNDKSWNELAGIGERAFDRLGDAIVNAFVSGQGAAVNFGNVARGIIGSIVSDIAKLALVNPILNSLFISTTGARPTLAGAFGGSATSFGGSGGLGQLLGLGNVFGSGGGIGSLFGSGGLGGLLSSQIISPFGGTAVGPLGEIIGASSGASLGGLLGGAGAGFGAGMLLNNLLGGNQLGGSIGSGLGSLAGAAIGSIIPGIGTLIGGLLGGAAGGGLGGLIGPGPSVKGYGLRFESSAFDPSGANYYAQGAALKPIDRTYYNESGAAAFQQAEQVVAAVNAYMSAHGLTVGGASIVEGNKDTAANLGAGFAGLRFSSASNAQLATYLNGQSFDDPAKLQAAVDGFTATQAVIESLTADAVPAFTASLKAVNDNFDAAGESARKYGLAEDALATARAKALDALEAARTETLRQTDASLEVRRLAAAGLTQDAELARQAEAARLEVTAFGTSLDALALTAEDKAARLVALEEVQAAERAAIIEKYGEQATAALKQDLDAGRSLLRDLAFGSASALAPEQRYFAALSTLNQAKQALDAGGSLSDYSAIAAQVLPVAHDYLGTSQRYGGLTAEISQVLASHGADGSAGLSQLINAQVGGFDGLQNVTLAIGDATVSELKSLRTAFDRMNATLEALITRRSAA